MNLLSPNIKIRNHKSNKMFPKEKVFADLLDKQKTKWIYAPHTFCLEGNETYTPDFYLPKEESYIEVVGSRQAYFSNKEKIKKFKTQFPNIKFFLCDALGRPLHIKPQKKLLETIQKELNSTDKRGRYLHGVALNVEEEITMQNLLHKGFTIKEIMKLGINVALKKKKISKIEIFRQGLIALQKVIVEKKQK